MIVGAVKLAKGVWDRVGKILGGVGEWLREDRDWWKFSCLVLAFVCLMSAFAVYERHRAVVTVQNECSLAGRICLAEKAELNAKAAIALAQLGQIEQVMAAEQRRLEELQARNRLLSAENERLHQVAGDTYDDWLERNKTRSPACPVLLAQLAESCPELEDY